MVFVGAWSAPAQTASPEGDSSPAPPLTRVSIFTSGVGEFFHETTVEDDEVVRLTIPRDQMSDVLRSLTILDADGGTPYQVDYAAGEPLQDQLRRFRIDLSGVSTLADLLRQVRGFEVSGRTVSGERFSGRVTAVAGGADEGRAHGRTGSVVLATGQSLQHLPISDIADISVNDEEISDDISRALELLADFAGSAQNRTLEIQLRGSGERRIGIRYLLEMPVWKTTYRAVLEEGEVAFQGWAHVDNTSPVDWQETTVQLVSSAPDTAFFDVYPPRYVERTGDGGAPEYAAESMPGPMRSMAFERTTTEQRVSGVGFTVSEPVTLRRGQSAMIPIVNGRFSAELVRSFDPLRDEAHPRLAFAFENEVDTRLPEGPLTLYDGDRYVGDAVLPVTPAGAERTVPYARDLELRITREQDQSPQELRTIRIAAGTLVAERRERLETRYSLERDGEAGTGATAQRGARSSGSSSRDLPSVRLSHPRRRGWDVVSPQPRETTTDTAVITVASPTTTVVEERILEQRYTLTEMDPELLVEFSSNRLLAPRVRRILQNILELREQLTTFRSERRELEARRDEIFRDQERIRGNMENLDRNSELYRRYVSQLESQENDLRFIRSDLEDAREEEAEALAALNAYLATLDS